MKVEGIKIAATPEAVDALRMFSEVLPKTMEDVDDCGRRLMCTFRGLQADLGPHEDRIQEMLENIRRAQEIAKDPIIDLSYRLKEAADRMELYLNHLSYTGTGILAKAPTVEERFAEFVENRLQKTGSSADALALYRQWQDNIVIGAYNHVDVPCYRYADRKIYLLAYADMHNALGSMSHYFHEVGHMLDDYAGNGQSWISSDPKFRRLLEEDFEEYVSQTVKTYRCDQGRAYQYISEELMNEVCHNVSDIFGAFSRCRCQGIWGHAAEYWKNPHAVEREAFANMFESSIGSEEKVKVMRKYLPNAYSYFEYLLRSAL